MNRKPNKVEEPATPYPAKKTEKTPAATDNSQGVRRLDQAAFKKSADKIFKVHHDLLRKLAQ